MKEEEGRRGEREKERDESSEKGCGLAVCSGVVVVMIAVDGGGVDCICPDLGGYMSVRVSVRCLLEVRGAFSRRYANLV